MQANNHILILYFSCTIPSVFSEKHATPVLVTKHVILARKICLWFFFIGNPNFLLLGVQSYRRYLIYQLHLTRPQKVCQLLKYLWLDVIYLCCKYQSRPLRAMASKYFEKSSVTKLNKTRYHCAKKKTLSFFLN